jgi:uncharacterized protein YcfL
MKTVLMSIILGACLVGCSSQQASSDHHATKTTTKTSTTNSSSQIDNVHVIKNDGTKLDVSLTASNNTKKAIFIHPSDFALSSNSTTLSPSSKSKVPSQIPANSKTNLTLDFDIKGQLSGTVQPKLGFQPAGDQPEQFQSLGSVKIPVPKKNSKPVSHTVSTTGKPSSSQGTVTSSPSTHNYQSDIANDVAILKAKATISVNGVQWSPMINSHPDAEVPDGSGGMLYAWNVVLDGDGDGSAQQIFFFDNNRYIGTDTAKYHLPSKVHAGASGTIIATYDHYLSNDPMCCASGQEFTVMFHWNGSHLTPNSVSTLNAAVNDQFKG